MDEDFLDNIIDGNFKYQWEKEYQDEYRFPWKSEEIAWRKYTVAARKVDYCPELDEYYYDEAMIQFRERLCGFVIEAMNIVHPLQIMQWRFQILNFSNFTFRCPLCNADIEFSTRKKQYTMIQRGLWECWSDFLDSNTYFCSDQIDDLLRFVRRICHLTLDNDGKLIDDNDTK